MFRAAFRRQRCLVPADGYYEWQPAADGKQPYYIKLADDGPFALAGLWARWSHLERTIQSCTIVTTVSNELTRSIHQRMPAILPPEAYDVWLDPDFADHTHLVSLLRPFASEAMRVHAVGRAVNRPTNDTPQCMAAVVQGDASNDEAATNDDEANQGRGGADGWLF
jgi:putative SOS response-associated peptidase YedK